MACRSLVLCLPVLCKEGALKRNPSCYRALPVYIVASFLKRMARIALVVPPSGALLILPFMYNIMQRHPTTKQMIHRAPQQTLGLGSLLAGATATTPTADGSATS